MFMKMKHAFITAICALSLFGSGTALSQEGKKQVGTPDFQVDFAQFRTDRPDTNRIEIYYRIFNSNLQFVKTADGYSAAYELALAIYDSKGHQINGLSRDRTVSVPDYARTISETDFRTSQINFDLAAGKYKIDCILTDQNSGAKSKRSLKLDIQKYDGGDPMVSGIEFVRAVDTTIYDSLFLKAGKTVIPSVGREYGGDSGSALMYYLELYQGSGKRANVMVETQLLNKRMDAVYRDTLTSVFAEPTLRQIRRISLTGIKAGVYTLEISLKGRRDKVVTDVREPLIIYWSPEAMVKNDFETAVSELKYIATPAEMKAFKKAATPEEKLHLWNQFWLKRDPTPGTPANEAKGEYYRRIDYANAHFSILRKEGWLTDRGSVYITYGEPDQIEDFPFELDSKAYQIWDYYQAGDVRRFLFIDEWGDGDYRLQYPYDGRY
ncbi:conserved exported hypothetical protein [Candidatus Zixiibacteriota bacterium]|nr:conserved exported hypothetical protein [candidate division Zixibacteria bacterium]